MSLIARAANAFKSIRASTFGLFVPMFLDGMPVYSDRKYRTYVREGYQQNELIFACIEKTANTAAQCKLEVRRKGDDDPIEDHDLRTLLDRPNPWMSEFDFWAMTLINMKLAGAAYWWKRRSGAGLVVEMWPLRPDRIAPVPGRKEFIEEWEYSPEGGAPFRLRTEDVLAFRKVDPLDPYKVVSPMKALGKSGDVDSAITDYLTRFFQRGANPAFVLKSKVKLSPQAITDIMNAVEKRYGGTDNWHKPLVLDSDADVVRTGLTFTEMEFSELDARNESRICMVLDVPPIIVGTRFGLERSTDTNYQNARKSWWEDSLIPLYKFLSDVIDAQLAPEFGDDIDTEWNFADVPALRESRDAQWKRATEAFKVGMITLNMALRECGLEEVGDVGEFFFRPIGGEPVPANETAEQQRERADEQAAQQQEAQLARLTANKPPGKTNEQSDKIDGQPEGKASTKITDVEPFDQDEIASLWALYGQLEKVQA